MKSLCALFVDVDEGEGVPHDHRVSDFERGRVCDPHGF